MIIPTGTENISTENKEIIQDAEIKTEVTEVKEPESKESLISKIATKIKDFATGGSKEEGDFIPDAFSEAAQALKWSDEEIIDFAANYTDEQLLEMLPSLKGDEDSVKTETTSTTAKPETTETKVDNSQDGELIKKLTERLEALEKVQGKSQADKDQQEVSNLTNRASQLFDETSKEFEVFGQTDKLPKFPDGRIVPTSPAMKARSEVWDTANRLYRTGMDFDTAMSVALNSYKGKNLANDVKRSIIKDLKSKEQKLSGKRVNHETTAQIEYGPDVIREVARRAGRDIN